MINQKDAFEILNIQSDHVTKNGSDGNRVGRLVAQQSNRLVSYVKICN